MAVAIDTYGPGKSGIWTGIGPMSGHKPGHGGGGGGGGGGGDGGNGGGKGKGNGGGDGDGSTTSFWTYTSGTADVYEAGVLVTDYYNITIEFVGTADDWGTTLLPDGSYEGGFIDAFVAAADYLSSIIVQGLSWDTFNGTDVDDIHITASLTAIDGAGGVLGQAGPESARDLNGNGVIDNLTVTGVMEFDIADADILLNGGSFDGVNDIDGGLWIDTVVHEMLHVLGIGTFWGYNNETGIDPDDYLGSIAGDPNTYDTNTDYYDAAPDWQALIQTIVDNKGTPFPFDDTVDRRYVGAAANLVPEAFLDVEDDGGSGTAGGHWDELVFEKELMTGYINSELDGDGYYNYLADFTIAALEDLGYALDPASTPEDMADAGTLLLTSDDPDPFALA